MCEPIKSGDWVCFLLLGTIVYGKVEYVIERTAISKEQLVTTAGQTPTDGILEVRRA